MEDLLAGDVGERIDALRPLAQELGLSMSQLAVAWCLRRSSVASAIVGVTRLAQLEDNVRGSGVTLPPSTLEVIDAIFPGPGSAA